MTGFSQVEETPYFGNMVIKMSLRMGSIPTVKNDGWTAVFNMGNQQGPTVKHRNSAQCYVAAWMGGNFGGERIHVYV